MQYICVFFCKQFYNLFYNLGEPTVIHVVSKHKGQPEIKEDPINKVAGRYKFCEERNYLDGKYMCVCLFQNM